MNFDVDRQTLNDLAIFQNHTSRQSVCGIFSHTNTIGGNEILQEIFTKPLIDAVELKERIAVFNFIEKSGTKISMDKNSYDFVDFYLKYLQTKAVSFCNRTNRKYCICY